MRILKIMLTTILILALVLGVAAYFITSLPQFGKAPSGEYLQALTRSPQHNGKVFVNEGNVQMSFTLSSMPKMIKAYMNKPAGMRPDTLPIHHPSSEELTQDTSAHLTWFGHSAFLLEIDTLSILLDPMLGPAAAPFEFQVKRFNRDLPISLEDLPEIDAVIYSHDHYDHLDYPTVLALKDKVKHFFVPLGLKGHLMHWGVEATRITEMDWWEETTYQGIGLTCTPSQHFSGRGLNDRGGTLWCSWVIKASDKKIFFSGDSGYFSGFKRIGKLHGPFDLALVECGQYNEMWQEIHMLPEESAQAAVDLNAHAMMPIHWGMFELALHPWKEPVQRVKAKADELNMPIITPQVGKRISLNNISPSDAWWETL
jgi:L-ascorbate metabolism protein UlaG (beta-lactamase superfamily)